MNHGDSTYGNGPTVPVPGASADTYGAIDPDVLMQMLADPQMAQQLAQLGIYDDRSKNLDRRAGMAAEMAMTPGAQGREVGRTYVASSPLEHAAVGIQRAIGMNQLHDINHQRDELVKGNAGAATTLAGAMAKAMRARRANSIGTNPYEQPTYPQPGDGFAMSNDSGNYETP